MATTAAQVKIIIETSLSDTDVDAFIADAEALMESSGVNDATCHTADSLDRVAKYLAAHLIGMRERQLTSEKEGDAEDKYGGMFGKTLEFTQYGQQVALFDCSGILKNLGGTDFFFDSAGGATI